MSPLVGFGRALEIVAIKSVFSFGILDVSGVRHSWKTNVGC